MQSELKASMGQSISSPMQRPQNRDAAKSFGSFYTWAVVAAALIVFAGFARTYYLRMLFGKPALPWLLHVHGALMTAWFVLFFVQTSLISAHRVDLHKRLGIFGGVLASTMVAVGIVVATRAAARDVHAA